MLMPRPLLLLLFGLLAGCGSDHEEKVFEEAQSPDGAWLAQGVDEHNFGPGNAAHFIRVTLAGTGKAVLNGGPQDILILEPDAAAEPYPGHPENHLKLRWQSPARLLLTYRKATADFVVARIAGVDVIAEAR